MSERDLPDALAEEAADRYLMVPPVERADALRALCLAHPEHAAALQALALELDGVERLLTDTFSEDGEPLPETIGACRVVAPLGEGAFGTVFRCRQEEPVAREVAVKVLRPGAGDRLTLQRFAAERQVLAELAHPTITQVFDAGALPDGRPYFVMEYVDGLPITLWCARRRAPLDERLGLFVDLCRGVEHAHRRGIVHRDLKPANVLVVEREGGPLPKIIDFGIAKALSPTRDRPGVLRTDAGRVVGSPGYMSPEQAAGRAADVDERADVFALGVILYELLTGRMPWPAGPDSTADPTPPSRSSGTPPTVPTHELRGDLDWIVLKALAFDRDDRYRDVPALVADLERHRRGEPVSVGPPSPTYRLRKLVRRHRTVAVSAAACLAGVALVGGIAWRSQRATRAEAAASFEDAMRVLDRLMASADAPALRNAASGDAPRESLLRDALAFYDEFLRERPTEPELRAGRCRALLRLSEVHWLLGQLEQAEAAALEGRDEAQALLEAAPESIAMRGLLAEAHRQLARARIKAGASASALADGEAAVALLEACFRAQPSDYGLSLAAALRELATGFENTGEDDSVIAAMRRSIEVLGAVHAADPNDPTARSDLVFARIGLGGALLGTGRNAAAQEVLLCAAAELPFASDRDRAESVVEALLARIDAARGDHPAALGRLERAVAAGERWRAAEPHRVLATAVLLDGQRALARARDRAGDWAGADAAFRGTIELAADAVERFPEDPTRSRDLCQALADFGLVLYDRYRRADLPEAEACLRRAIELHATIADGLDDRLPLWKLHVVLADILTANGSEERGAAWAAVAAALPAGAGDAAWLAHPLIGLAQWHFDAGRIETAAEHIARAHRIVAAASPALDRRMVDVADLEARLAAARGDHAAAAAAADAVLAARPTWLGRRTAGDCLYRAWQCAAGDAGARAAYAERAAALYRSVRRELRADAERSPDDPWFVVPFGIATVRLAALEAAGGDPDTVRELLRAGLPALEAIAESAHADQWEPEAVLEARALAESLGLPVR